MYMLHNLTINNLKFYTEANQFKEDMRVQFEKLHRRYIDDKSAGQVTHVTHAGEGDSDPLYLSLSCLYMRKQKQNRSV